MVSSEEGEAGWQALLLLEVGRKRNCRGWGGRGGAVRRSVEVMSSGEGD